MTSEIRTREPKLKDTKGKTTRRPIYLWLALLVILLAACSQEPPPPPPALAGGDLQVASVASPVPGAIAGVRPAATATLAPLVTVVSGPTATLAPSPPATQAPVHLFTAEDFGLDRNPLTGEAVADPALLDRRPLAIKISNAPPQWVRPQSGLNDADLVFEHITEAGITRFTMIIYGKTPPDVGPIRSARLIDLELPAMYDAALVYSGSSDGVRQRLLNSDFRPRILFGSEPGYYRTGADKPYEHTLYATPATLWDHLAEKGQNVRPVFNTNMAFSSETPAGGESANEITIDYRWTNILWRYDVESGRYLRWADGEIHSDGNTDEQVSSANVVVIFANHIEDQTICEQITNGVCTALSVQPQIFGTGPAIIFRDGQRYTVTWQRIGRYDMFTFVDANGQPLPLQIGNSWMQVIPTWYENPVSTTP